MTRAFYERNGNTLTLTCNGHAGYAECGKDIVCAGISALCGALEIALDDLHDKGCLQSHFCSTSEAYFQACAEQQPDSNAAQTVFDVIYNGLCRIAESYPDFLQCSKNIQKKEDQ